MQIIESEQLDFEDVLICPRRTTLASRKDVDVKREYKFKWCPSKITGTGIITANMGTVGTFNVAKHMLKHDMFACLHKHYDINELIDFYKSLIDEKSELDYKKCLLSIGLQDNGVEKIREIKNQLGITVSIKLDVPNGYIPQVKQMVISLRNEFPDMFIMVGNVVTGDITEDLILSGADCVAAGIGGGSACRTREKTGVGRPQLSTIIECAESAHQVGGMLCSDGGITCPGDICKALCAGADFVMIGGMFAGTDEADGEVIEKTYATNERDVFAGTHTIIYETKKFKQFYGMSSYLAQEKFCGGRRNYRSSEGAVINVPCTGPIDDMIEDITGGIRSMQTYIGAARLKDIPKCTIFYKVNNQRNHVYDNYMVGR